MSKKLFLFTLLLELLIYFWVADVIGYDKPVLMERVRSMSMGGAEVAIVDDENALFSNPAGLENIEDSRFTALSFGAKFNPDTLGCVDELRHLYDKSRDFNSLSWHSVDKLQSYKPLLSISPLALIYIRHKFALAIINTEVNVKGDYDYDYTNRRSTVEFSGHGDTAMMLSAGSHVYKGLSVGGTMKYLIRLNMESNPANDLVDLKPTIPLGRGFGFDIGLLWKYRDWSAGLSIRDIFGTELAWENGIVKGYWEEIGRKTTKIDKDVTIGFSYNPDWKLASLPYIPKDLIFAVDIDAIHNFMENLHLGVEAKIFHWLAVRAGINKGLRLGFGLDTNMWDLDFMYATHLRDDYIDRVTYNNFCFSVALSY